MVKVSILLSILACIAWIQVAANTGGIMGPGLAEDGDAEPLIGCMDGFKVEILGDGPESWLDGFDRYTIRILGTDRIAYPWKKSVNTDPAVVAECLELREAWDWIRSKIKAVK